MFLIRFIRAIFRFDSLRSALCFALGWLIFVTFTDTLITIYDAQSAFHPFSTYDWYRLFGGPTLTVDDAMAGTLRCIPIFGMLFVSGVCYRSRFGHSILMLNAGYVAASMGLLYRMYGEHFRLGQWLSLEGEWAVLIALVLAMTIPYWKWRSLRLPQMPRRQKPSSVAQGLQPLVLTPVVA